MDPFITIVEVPQNFEIFSVKVVGETIPCTDALLPPTDAHLAYLWGAILLDGQKNWPRQAKSLLISARLREPPLMQGGQSGVAGGKNRVRIH